MKRLAFWGMAGLLSLVTGCVSSQRSPEQAASIDVPPVDWQSLQWIGDGKPLPEKDEDFYRDDPAPLFRKTFEVKKRSAVSRAVLQIACLGYYNLAVNGRQVSETSLMPLWTPVGKRILVDSYDVTKWLRDGENVVTVELGNGWYNPLPLRMWRHINLRNALTVGRPCFQLHLRLADGDGNPSGEIVSDTSWKMTEGPVVRNSIYLGVVYDARRELDGWRLPGYDDDAWKAAVAVTGTPGKRQPRNAPALRPFAPVSGSSNWLRKGSVQVIDFGSNSAGIAEFMLGKGEAGEKITFLYGERLNGDGSVNPMTVVCGQIKVKGAGGPGAPDVALERDTYIRSGKGNEIFAPQFCWHAFRYVQVEGLSELLTPQQAVRTTIASDVQDVSEFTCSSPELNRLHAICRQSFLSNIFGVQSDCPGRERFGYGGDIAATTESFLMNFDMRTFYLKTMQDFADEAEEGGLLTETAPYVGIHDRGYGGISGPIGWAIGFPVMLNELVRYYGDEQALSFYPVCARQVRILRSKYPDNLLPHCIGDHEALEKPDTGLTATAHYYQFVTLTARFAKLLGRTDDAGEFNLLADQIRLAFLKKYTKGALVGKGTQSEQAFGLALGLLPDSERKEALEILERNIEAHQYGITTGIFATKFLLDLLSRENRSEIAGKMVARREFPGWLHMLANGATTVWETWKESDNTFSNNHPMFGSVDAWMMKHLLGIEVAPDAIGANRVIIHPEAVAGVTWAKGSYRTPYGPVKMSWQQDSNRVVRMKVTIPGGVSARVWVDSQKRWVEVQSGDHQW